jgi:hypothetical protein
MPMEGDAFTSYTAPVTLFPGGRESEPVYAAPPVVQSPATWAQQAAAFASTVPRAPTPKGGPASQTGLTPLISGGFTGTAGREGDYSYTPQSLQGFYSYSPDKKFVYTYDVQGNFQSAAPNPEGGVLKELAPLVTDFILPAVSMYTGVNALGSLFGAGGALGGVSGATQAAAEQAAAADIAGGMVPEFASNAAYDAAMNQAVAAGTAGVAPEALPSIFADTTAPSIPTTDYGFTPSYELPAPTPVAPAVPDYVPTTDYGFTPSYELPAPTPVAPAVPDYVPTTDYGFTPSYELAPPSVPQGIQAPIINEPITVGTTPIDYSLNVPSQNGLQLPSMPSLPSMGGAQGLTAAVPGGTVGELGFTPTGVSPVLGDPASFINNPAVTGQPTIPSAPAAPSVPVEPLMTEAQFASILKSLPGLLGGALGASVMPSASSATQLPAYQPASTMPQYSPEYFQQIQQRYNQIMPSRPADVVTPLSQWYNKPADSSVVTKLFGVI